MSMLSSVLATTGWAARKTLVVASLTFIGLVVGIGCVLLPIGVPIGIVGVAGLVLLWAIPDLQSVPSRLARRSFTPFLFTSLSVPFYLAIVIPGLPFISIRRAFLYIFVGALVITISASSKYRRILMQRLKSVPSLFYVTAAYYALIIVTIPISESLTSTLNGLTQFTMTWFLPILAVVLFIEKDVDIINVFKTVLLCLFVDFLIGAIEFRIQRPVPWQLLPAATRSYMIANNPMYSGMETGNFRDGVYRAMSIYTVGLSWAEMVSMSVPIAAYFAAHGTSIKSRLIGFAGLIACLLSLIFSGSRGGYVCSIAALSSYAVFWAIRKSRQHPENLLGGFALFLCSTGVAVVIAAITFVPKFHIMILGNGATQTSNMGRDLQWAEAIPIIEASPLWGHGFATASALFPKTNYWGGEFSLDDYRINLLVENGVLGLCLFFGTLSIAVWISLRIYLTDRSAIATTGATIASSLIAYGIDRTTTSQSDNNTLMYVLIGLTFAIQRAVSSNRQTLKYTRSMPYKPPVL